MSFNNVAATWAIWLVLLAPLALTATQPAEETVDVIRFINEITNNIRQDWNTKDLQSPLGPDTQRKLMERLELVSTRMRSVEQLHIRYARVAFETLCESFNRNKTLAIKLNTVSDLIKSITLRYQQLTEYDQLKDSIEPTTLMLFANWNVKRSNNTMPRLMEQLHGRLFVERVYGEERSLLATLALDYEQSQEQICAAQQSPQQFVYDLYTTVMLNDLKGYIVMEFAWMVLREFAKGDYEQDLQLMREAYQQRKHHSELELHQVMKRSGRVLWRCDPVKHVPGETYDKLTRLLQGYVENEINMSAEQSCWQTCDYYHNARSLSCQAGKFCDRQSKCKGSLYNCQSAASYMSVCAARVNGTRRYTYIEYANGRRLGDEGTKCNRPLKVENSWNFLLRCSYCLCLCDEVGALSDRYFNLRQTLANFKQNMVVTGLRFIKRNRIFHLQLQQGKLLPRAAINQSTLAWLPEDAYSLSDVDIRDGYDYTTLSFQRRTIDLDEITAGTDGSFAVTGVRFRMYNKHLNLEVRFSELNFVTGQLLPNSFWKSNDNADVHSDKRRHKLRNDGAGLPTKSPFGSWPLSKHNQYMEFVSSSWDMDAAQNTVPFIDIQPVVPTPAVPLAGVGIYHKGFEGYAGFFAPKLITYDYA